MLPQFFLLQLFIFSYTKASDVIPVPLITFIHKGPEWRNVSSPKLSFYSPKGDDILFKCSSSHPVQWTFDGFIVPPEVAKILPPKRHLDKNIFEIQTNMFFGDATNYPGLAASATIACTNVAVPSVRQEFSIFIRGSSPSSLVQPEVNVVIDSFLLPCVTTDPVERVLLYRRVSATRDEVELVNAKYDPIRGFTSQEMFHGEYICAQGNTRVFLRADKSLQTAEYTALPSQKMVKAFSEDEIEFKCSSKSGPVNLVAKESKLISVKMMEDTHTSKRVSVTVLKEAAEMLPSNFSLTGRMECTTDRGQLIKKWSFEFIATPQLQLNNFESEVDCLSDLKDGNMIQTVRCKNKFDCDFMSHCLRNTSLCNFKKQKQFYGDTVTWCYVQSLGEGVDCVTVPYSHLNGLAQCTVGGLKRKWEIFISLAFLKYSSWLRVPERELLAMDEVDGVLYTNKTSQFFCEAVSYLFADSLSFEMEFANTTRILLEDDGDLVNISRPSDDDPHPRKIDEFNVIGILNIKLPIDAIAIHCIAPWWNSTDVIRTSRVFETRHLLSPTFVHSGDKVNEQFFIGEKNRRLTCHAHGEPQPVYLWLFNGKNATDIFPDLRISSGSNGERHLEFPQVEAKFAGSYNCIAKNDVSEVKMAFILEITDEPISSNTVVYITTVVIVLLVLACVSGAFFILARRYKIAKELVRNLTDSEIDEFFRGKPELLSNVETDNMNIIDFLPYKSNYEIAMSDIQFDSSEKNWLGAGEFSYVVKGKINSQCRWVAIKISKPTADVTLFKSLLSEVKIMIYIGDHENVVKLVGVCTEGIRSRCIYIATEICDLGSLDSFLRKGRPKFTDLLNGNQEIDTSLMPEDGTQLSTLDLISFSAQIATGMEYLASKSVIHADLAARNVLLAGNKTAKISDFGLSKKLYECNNYVKKSKSPLPWRWMSTEALTTLTFSTQSDVWSYGATLYEIFTLGDIPFPNEEWTKEFLTRLASGMRMGRPKYSTQEIYSKIVACWENEPEIRPSFTVLRTFFDKLLERFPREILVKADIPLPNQSQVAPTVTESLYVNCDDAYPIHLNYTQPDFEHPGHSPINYVNLVEND